MQTIRLPKIQEPDHSTRAILRGQGGAMQNNWLILGYGGGDVDLRCGYCGRVLAGKIFPGSVCDVVLVCAFCDTFNDTPAAHHGRGAPLRQPTMDFPVGVHWFSAPILLRSADDLLMGVRADRGNGQDEIIDRPSISAGRFFRALRPHARQS